MALSPADIGNLGERQTTAALQADGWQCYRNTQQPGSTDIQAQKGNRRILVQVKTGLVPNHAPDMPSDERRNIVSRASRLGYEAWLAQLQINSQGALIGQISWSNLS